MKNQTKKPFPKKAKLITDSGFYQILALSKFQPKIFFPLSKRITLASPETNILDIPVHFTCEFIFSRVYKGYAEYKQVNVTSNIIR